MARPQKNRRVCSVPAVDRFAPDPQPQTPESAPVPETGAGSKAPAASPVLRQPGSGTCADREPVILTIDEYEVLRLVDHEGLTHSECARQMNISRTTATEICESARRKVAEAIVCGRELVIEGGSWELCEGNRKDCFLGSCTRAGQCGTDHKR